MGLIIKKTTLDQIDDDIDVGSEVVVKDTGTVGVVVMKVGTIYQVKIDDEIKSYTYDEIEKE